MQFLDIALAENHSMLNFQLHVQRGPHRKNKNTAQISVYSHRNSPALTNDMYTWGPLGIGDSSYKQVLEMTNPSTKYYGACWFPVKYRNIPYFFDYKTEFFPSKTIPKI